MEDHSLETIDDINNQIKSIKEKIESAEGNTKRIDRLTKVLASFERLLDLYEKLHPKSCPDNPCLDEEINKCLDELGLENEKELDEEIEEQEKKIKKAEDENKRQKLITNLQEKLKPYSQLKELVNKKNGQSDKNVIEEEINKCLEDQGLENEKELDAEIEEKEKRIKKAENENKPKKFITILQDKLKPYSELKELIKKKKSPPIKPSQNKEELKREIEKGYEKYSLDSSKKKIEDTKDEEEDDDGKNNNFFL